MSSDAAPAQPQAILRGHKAQVHAASFVRGNDRLATGDADGFVILWDLAIMRSRAVWQAHTNAILGIAAWGDERIITHGRDNKLIIWKLGAADENAMSTSLPLDTAVSSRPQPWMVYMLEVNTMNFCAFASCAPIASNEASAEELLIAVPNTLASEAIDIFHLPSQLRQHTVKLGDKNGMVMALSMFNHYNKLTIAAGYENGLAVVAQLNEDGFWALKYRAQIHSQPILSLDVAPSLEYFVTAGADAVIAKHPLPARLVPPVGLIENTEVEAAEALNTPQKQASQDSGPMHKNQPKEPVSLLSATLAAQPSRAQPSINEPSEPETHPLKVINTKHAGQQGVRIRSDGRVFATAGWDAKVRVYSTKTLREVAVLKWHQVGCYAIAFSDIEAARGFEVAVKATTNQAERPGSVVPRLLDVTVKERRLRHATTAHWLAAGSKDGKVSLWDVF